MGLKKRWTQEELEILRSRYPTTAPALMVGLLGRNWPSIQKMAQLNGIHMSRDLLGCIRSQAAHKNPSNTRFQSRHGRAGCGDETYLAWKQMNQRCKYVSHKSHKDYGGRGITVCDRWDTFENFLADMGEKPKGMTLGRIDNDGNYSSDNCRWEDMRQQARNRRNNRIIEAFGEKRILVEWSERFGIKASTIANRLSRNIPPDVAISTPTRSRRDGSMLYRVTRAR